MLTENSIKENLRQVVDPEIGLSVVDLGLIYNIEIKPKGLVKISMTLTTPACPYGPELIDAVRIATDVLDEVKRTEIEIVWDPPWEPGKMATDYAKDELGIW